MEDNNFNKKIAPMAWVFRIIIGIAIPAVVFMGLIYLPYYWNSKDKDLIYSIYWSVTLVFILFSPVISINFFKNWIENNEEIIGWYFNALLSYALPIGIILSVALLDLKHINMTMTYLSSGFALYVGLRMQANYSITKCAWILPLSMTASFIIISNIYGFPIVVAGLALSFIVYLLGIRISKRRDCGQHNPIKNVCPGLIEEIEPIVEKDKLKGVAFCILIRDFLYNWSRLQRETAHREAILNKIKPLNDCFNNPIDAISEMTTFSPELIVLYHHYDDEYYNLALVAKIIKDECTNSSQK